MELLAQCGCKLAQCICDAGVRRMKNSKKLSSTIDNLRDKKGELVARESDMKAKLQREEERRKQPLEVVKDWLKKVEKAKTKVDNTLRSYDENGNNCCFSRFYGLFELAERVDEVIKDVDELLGKQFPDGLVTDELPAKATLFNSLSLLRSRSTTTKEKIEEIMEVLRKPENSKVGVWGMGGIGKTTIMKSVHDKLAATKEFNLIIWATVSKDMGGIEMLQNRIAEGLVKEFRDNLSRENDIVKRASMLLNELKKYKKLLLILDDVWNEISLDKVGIPDPERSSEGCKIVITTRSLRVCDYIKTQAQVEIKPLSDEEAWNLFKAMIGDDQVLQLEGNEDVAKEVVRECGGLPLAIITVAPVMRRTRDIEQWRHKLKELKSSKAEIRGPEGDVFQLLRFSYDHLKGEQVKKCFLYCAFYPEDHEIHPEELIEYWIAEGYTEEENEGLEYNAGNRRDEIGKGRNILKELTDSCMLETVQHEEREYVWMHDLVRDLAIQIMEKDCGFVSKAGKGLTAFPELAWEKVHKISLMSNGIPILPDHRPLNCPNLSTLILRGLKKLPFERLPALENIYGTTEWWEELEFDDPAGKTLLQPHFMHRISYDHDIQGFGKF